MCGSSGSLAFHNHLPAQFRVVVQQHPELCLCVHPNPSDRVLDSSVLETVCIGKRYQVYISMNGIPCSVTARRPVAAVERQSAVYSDVEIGYVSKKRKSSVATGCRTHLEETIVLSNEDDISGELGRPQGPGAFHVAELLTVLVLGMLDADPIGGSKNRT
jgi:hypothetical protein